MKICRKSLVIGIVFFIIGASVIQSTNSNEIQKDGNIAETANVWIVDNEGDGHFTSLQSAINDYNVKDGDTIHIYSGTYFESVFVDKELIINGYDYEYGNGSDTGKPVIDAGGETNAVIINADYVTVSGLIIKNGYYPYSSYSGILINSKHNKISENEIIENNNGFTLEEGSSDNIISDNIIKYNEGRIYLHKTSNNQILDNIIEENNHTSIISLEFSHNNSFIGNSISENNNNRGASAFNLFESSYNIISWNKILNNNGPGLFIWPNSCNNQIFNNIITNKDYIEGKNVEDYGIYICSSSTDNYIAKNTIKGHKEAGIYIELSSNNIIFNNEISENEEYGIYIIFGYNNHITLNNFRDNKCDARVIYSIQDWINEHNNIWSKNFWSKPRVLPKLIFGYMQFKILTIPIIWVDIDWRPAQSPYEI